jgi:hypothetical protein
VASNYRPLPTQKPAAPAVGRPTDRNFELKSAIHKKLLGVLNLERVS